MLFQSQRNELTGTQYNMYFAGAAIMKNAMVALVTGVRNDTKTDVIATVQYLYENGTTKTPFSKNLSPAEFERFLNEFAMKVATVSKGAMKLTELKHNFIPIDDTKFPDLSDEGKDAALRVYLLQLITGNPQQDAIRSAGAIIKQFIQQR